VTATQPPARAGILFGAALAVLGVMCALGATSCTFLHSRAQRTVTLSLPRPRPSALIIVLFRGTATIVRTEFRTMVGATARPGEHLIVIDGNSGRELGSFIAPSSPSAKAPAPPAPLGKDPTMFQRGQYQKSAAAYQAMTRAYVARLRTREREWLSAWAATVLVKVTGGNGLEPGTGRSPLASDLSSAIADFTSMAQSGAALGDRKVLAIIGFPGPSADSAPALSVGLQQAMVVVTGFPADPGAQRAYRLGLQWEGAGRVVLLTRAASSELTPVVASGLDGEAGPRVLGSP
jgi:hypothetical protein